ncbi:hypothetical protein [Geminisphaera colitermitum]|uniref:hypothetical protein n=1 Tax=Geminisphaera colitermitum TaxID=1148786 RepID=UPI0012FF55A4|nr:hypothetical protein [Geminisphaera colitermitum]
MTSAHAHEVLACPKCRGAFEVFPLSLQTRPRYAPDEERRRCPRCERVVTLVPFPALRASPRVVRAQALVAEGEASCFFHATNQAATVCDDCGRFLCAVCAVEFSGETLCPSCISARREKSARMVSSRVTYDSLAFLLALVPLLMFWMTCVTAPVALGLAIYGWRKPPSLVRGGRWRLVAAMILASVEIAAWGVFLIKLLA